MLDPNSKEYKKLKKVMKKASDFSSEGKEVAIAKAIDDLEDVVDTIKESHESAKTESKETFETFEKETEAHFEEIEKDHEECEAENEKRFEGIDQAIENVGQEVSSLKEDVDAIKNAEPGELDLAPIVAKVIQELPPQEPTKIPFTKEQIVSEVVRQISELFPSTNIVTDTPVQIAEKLESLEGTQRLDFTAIDGLEEYVTGLLNELTIKSSKGYSRIGAGVTQIKAGAGITIESSMVNGRGVVTITSTATGGGSSVTETEVDFGTMTAPVTSWTIPSVGMDATKKILVFPSPSVATGRKGNDWEVDSAIFTAVAGVGQFVLSVIPQSRMVGNRKIYYQVI